MVNASKMINSSVVFIIIIVILFSAYQTILPETQAAGNDLNASNRCVAEGCFFNGTQDNCLTNSSPTAIACGTSTAVPLSGLVGGNGIVFVIIMAALLIIIVRSSFKQM